MIGTLIALTILITILVIGYFVGPLLGAIHIIIAGIWYVRAKKENKEKRKYRPSTGPVYFLTGATLLAIYGLGYGLDKFLGDLNRILSHRPLFTVTLRTKGKCYFEVHSETALEHKVDVRQHG